MLPTPTPIPEGDRLSFANNAPQLNFPRVWDLAQDAVQTWNSFGSATQVLQAIILAGIVALAIYLIYRFFKRITADGRDED